MKAQTTTHNTKSVARMLGIFPQTRKTTNCAFVKMEIRLECGSQAFRPFAQAVRGIKWARETGRLTGNTEMAIRSLSPYRKVKLVVDITNKGMVMNDVPGYLNEKLG